MANIMNYRTLKLDHAPPETSTTLQKAWEGLFDAFGFAGFHPLEGRGVLMNTMQARGSLRSNAEAILTKLMAEGFLGS